MVKQKKQALCTAMISVVPMYTCRSFTLKVKGDNVKGMDGKSWTLMATKLPHNIDPDSSHIKVHCVAFSST